MWNKSLLLIGRYSHRDSPIHRLDPRTKIIWLAAWVASIALLLNGVSYILLALYAILMIVAARLTVREVGSVLWAAIPLALITFALHVLFAGSSGDKLLDWGWLQVGSVGVSNGVLYSSRVGLFLAGATVVNLTTRPTDFADSISLLMKPLRYIRVPVADISLMIFVSLRFIPLIVDEASMIRMSMVSRGIPIRKGPVGKIRSMIPVVIPLMTSSIRRAETLSLAIESRGYRRGADRTSLRVYRMRSGDWGFLALGALAFAMIYLSGSIL